MYDMGVKEHCDEHMKCILHLKVCMEVGYKHTERHSIKPQDCFRHSTCVICTDWKYIIGN